MLTYFRILITRMLYYLSIWNYFACIYDFFFNLQSQDYIGEFVEFSYCGSLQVFLIRIKVWI